MQKKNNNISVPFQNFTQNLQPTYYLQVIDALELAFKELDSEDSAAMDDTRENETKEQVDFIDKKITVAPLYENMDIFYQNSSEFCSESAFPLDMPTNVLEPPKEKPPPPPTDDSAGDELLGNVSCAILINSLSD